jgi:hypothetical protein
MIIWATTIIHWIQADIDLEQETAVVLRRILIVLWSTDVDCHRSYSYVFMNKGKVIDRPSD